MRDVKKILEMRFQNFIQRKIAEALKVSRNTVRKVSKAAMKTIFVGHLHFYFILSINDPESK